MSDSVLSDLVREKEELEFAVKVDMYKLRELHFRLKDVQLQLKRNRKKLMLIKKKLREAKK